MARVTLKAINDELTKREHNARFEKGKRRNGIRALPVVVRCAVCYPWEVRTT